MLQISSPYDIIAASSILDVVVLGMMIVFSICTLYPILNKGRSGEVISKLMDLGLVSLVTFVGWVIMILLQSFLLWVGSGYLSLVGQELESFSNIILSAYETNWLSIPLCLGIGSVLGLIFGDVISKEKEDGTSRLGVIISTFAVSFFLSIMVVLFFQQIGLFVVVA